MLCIDECKKYHVMYTTIVNNISDVNNVSIVGNVSIVKYLDLPIIIIIIIIIKRKG